MGSDTSNFRATLAKRKWQRFVTGRRTAVPYTWQKRAEMYYQFLLHWGLFTFFSDPDPVGRGLGLLHHRGLRIPREGALQHGIQLTQELLDFGGAQAPRHSGK